MDQKTIKIISLKKNKNKFQVLTSEGEITVDEETIVRYQILKDHEFTEKEYQQILNFLEQNKAFNLGLRYLSYQLRSKKEIIFYLTQKEIPTENIEYALSKLVELHYIDDCYLAKTILESEIRNKKGPKFIRQKLKRRLIDEDLINEVLMKYEKDLEIEKINECLLKLSTKYSKYPIAQQQLKIINKLLRDGFSGDLVSRLVRSYPLTDDSSLQLEKDYQRLLKKYQDTPQSKNKIISSLLSKGYSLSKINEKFQS